jgi:hypothetical protein
LNSRIEKEKQIDEVIRALRKLVPLNGLAPNEQIRFPKFKEVPKLVHSCSKLVSVLFEMSHICVV